MLARHDLEQEPGTGAAGAALKRHKRSVAVVRLELAAGTA